VPKAWELDKIPDPDEEMEINYVSFYEYFTKYLNSKKGAKKDEIDAFARFAACFPYQGGIDRSREAFNNCHDYDVSARTFLEAYN